MRYYLCFYVILNLRRHFLIVSLVGMTAFEKVAKAYIGKFEQNILFLSVKVNYLLNCKN